VGIPLQLEFDSEIDKLIQILTCDVAPHQQVPSLRVQGQSCCAAEKEPTIQPPHGRGVPRIVTKLQGIPATEELQPHPKGRWYRFAQLKDRRVRGLSLAFSLGVLGAIYIGLSLLGLDEEPSEVGRAYGELAGSILEGGPYRSCGKIFGGPCLSAHRLPLIPAFLALAELLQLGSAWTSVLKQVLFVLVPLSAGVALLVRRCLGGLSLGNLSLLILLMLNPTFLKWASWRNDVEEGYLAGPLFFLGSLLAASSARETERRTVVWLSAWAGVLLAVIYLTKSSLFYFVVVMGSVLAVRVWAASRLASLLVVAPLLLSLAFWLSHTASVLGSPMPGTSIDTFNLYKGNNRHFSAVYPRGTFNGNLDALDSIGATAPTRALHSEAELSRHYRELVIEQVQRDPWAALERSSVKAFVFFFDPRASIVKISLVRELIFGLPLAALKISIWVAFIMALLGTTRELRPTLFSLVVVGSVLYAAPLVAGFGYQHHVFPLAFFLAPIFWVLRKPS